MPNVIGCASSGFQDASLWEETKKKGDTAIKKLIDEGHLNEETSWQVYKDLFRAYNDDFVALTEARGFKKSKSIGRSIRQINTIDDFIEFVDNFKEEIGNKKAQ